MKSWFTRGLIRRDAAGVPRKKDSWIAFLAGLAAIIVGALLGSVATGWWIGAPAVLAMGGIYVAWEGYHALRLRMYAKQEHRKHFEESGENDD